MTIWDAFLVVALASTSIIGLAKLALFVKHRRKRNDAVWETQRVLHAVRAVLTDNPLLVEGLMRRCFADKRWDHIFHWYKKISPEAARASFCELALQAAYGKAVIEMAFLTHEFVSSRKPLILSLTKRMQLFYKAKVSHYELNPDECIAPFSRIDGIEKTVRERQEELSTFNEISLPENECERNELVRKLAERFEQGEIVFSFRRYDWWRRAELGRVGQEAEEGSV